MRSNTTRRSAPITRSRLRRPTSKSMTTTFSPPCASAAPRAAEDVVLPTPPLPEVTTKTLAIVVSLSLIQCFQDDGVAIQVHLHGLAEELAPEIVSGLVETVDRDQF